MSDEALFRYARDAGRDGCEPEMERALGRLLWKFGDRIRFWAQRATKNPEHVEEISSRTIFQAMKSIHQAPPEGDHIRSFGAWLRQINWYVTADYFDELSGREEHEGALPDEHEGDETTWGVAGTGELGRKDGMPMHSPDGIEGELVEGESEERAGELREEALPGNPRHRRVVALAGSEFLGFEGRPAKEAAEVVNQEFAGEPDPMTDVNVHQILTRYRKKLDELRQADNQDEADA